MIKKLVVVIPLVLSFLLLPAFALGDPAGGDVYTLLPDSSPPLDGDGMALAESSVYSLSPITSSDTTGLTSLVLSLIGNYDPVVVEYRYENYNGSYSYVREIQPDYPWLISAGIFAIVLFCTLRILGGAVCKK